ncbi:DUF2892 domain-containing protein [Flavobacterium sp. K5-23]|uniref:YgaP family membrane protein n=1 Tax=Flavobacterium sp. K5-23 TaxID=2746225 RepID=UPI00200E2A6C|nr:DUF2892 domain-containing protein [Flavobacterium sp. K5-23]UQD56614.1 DUF2892 domain-containing protein [Flavobacterium sp. K5-23]
MKKNMGLTDKIIRITIAAIIALMYFSNIISGTLALVLGAFAAIFLITSFVGVCPMYTLFGSNTCEKK